MGECMTGQAGSLDWPALIGAVAVALLGEPNAALSNERELRWGRRGSLAVHVAGPYAGRFRDHEEGTGGGVLDLIQRERGGNRCEAWAWLRVQGLLTDGTVHVQARSPRGGTKHGADGRETRDKRERAHQIWKETRPLRCTLVEAYLHRRAGAALSSAPSTSGRNGRVVLAGCLRAGRRGAVSRDPAHLPAGPAQGLGPAGSRESRAAHWRRGSSRRAGGRCAAPRRGDRVDRGGHGVAATPGWAALGTAALRALALPEAIREVVIATQPGSTRRRRRSEATILAGLPESFVALVARSRQDPGAPFEPAALEHLTRLRTGDLRTWVRVRALLKDLGVPMPDLDRQTQPRASNPNGHPTQASKLIDIAERGCRLFHGKKETFAEFEHEGRRETWPVSSRGFSWWLRLRYFQDIGGAPTNEALQTAKNSIEATARFKGPAREVYRRVGSAAGTLYLDLCNDLRPIGIEIEQQKGGRRLMRISVHPTMGVEFRLHSRAGAAGETLAPVPERTP